MFLFKNTKSIVKRIAMNMAVYGLAGAFVLMMFALFLPEIIANYIYVFMVICSVLAIIGFIISIVWFFIELFSPVKQGIKQTTENRATKDVTKEQESLEKFLKTDDQDRKKVLEEVRLWEQARRRCDPERIRSLKEREYQYLQCFHRGGVEPEVAAKMYGFVLVNGSAVDQEVFYHYQQLRRQEKQDDTEA